eukprot:TRINITY_DN5839_c0_g1_i1.p1 TRINITY_DN5839_c0_g1~~TRINITY_DN5839_c0_g1_i1.p1  ORF type:complete len:321 (-),score=-19.57 TRINITY_DN5839_c0_g1_i1:140-1012(-)
MSAVQFIGSSDRLEVSIIRGHFDEPCDEMYCVTSNSLALGSPYTTDPAKFAQNRIVFFSTMEFNVRPGSDFKNSVLTIECFEKKKRGLWRNKPFGMAAIGLSTFKKVETKQYCDIHDSNNRRIGRLFVEIRFLSSKPRPQDTAVERAELFEVAKKEPTAVLPECVEDVRPDTWALIQQAHTVKKDSLASVQRSTRLVNESLSIGSESLATLDGNRVRLESVANGLTTMDNDLQMGSKHINGVKSMFGGWFNWYEPSQVLLLDSASRFYAAADPELSQVAQEETDRGRAAR